MVFKIQIIKNYLNVSFGIFHKLDFVLLQIKFVNGLLKAMLIYAQKSSFDFQWPLKSEVSFIYVSLFVAKTAKTTKS